MEKVVGREIKTKDLEDVTLESYQRHVKSGTVDHIENELALLDGLQHIGIPSTLIHLPMEQVNMLVFMVSNDIVCEYTGKKTLNNILESYIETFRDDKTVSYLIKRSFKWHIQFETNYNTGERIVIRENWIRDTNGTAQYLTLKRLASQFWNDNNLKQHMPVAKDVFVHGGISKTDKFKDSIFDDAINNEDPTVRARFSAMHMKIEGLDKNKGGIVVNLFDKHGGKELASQSAKVSGNSLYDTQSIIEAEFDEVENGDENES